MSTVPDPAPRAWGPRLFVPGEGPAAGGPQLSPEIRLRTLFDQYVLPVVGKACNWSKGTVASYEESVDHWGELTNDVGLAQIDALETAEFVAGLRLQAGRAEEFLSIASIRKHCGNVQRLLAIAGPQLRRTKKDLRRFGCGLIGEPPWIEAPDPEDRPPDGDFTLEEIKAILAACSQMTTPRIAGVAPGVWWEALVTFLCFTGLRIGATMALEWPMLDPQLRLLKIPAAISKGRKAHRQYVCNEAHDAIAPLKAAGALRIFPWKNYPRPGATRWLQRQREALLERAGLPQDRWFGFHGFRKYHGTELWEIDEQAAVESLNHASADTTRKSYVNGRRQLEADIRRRQAAIDRMPRLRD
jgi:integrase